MVVVVLLSSDHYDESAFRRRALFFGSLVGWLGGERDVFFFAASLGLRCMSGEKRRREGDGYWRAMVRVWDGMVFYAMGFYSMDVWVFSIGLVPIVKGSHD